MKILVLSGGGSHGAYQVGVLKRLVEAGKSWDVITGVSVGALNGTYLAMYKKSEIASGMKELEEIWNSIHVTTDIIKPWAPWLLNYIWAWFKGSLKNTEPLFKLLDSKFNAEMLRNSDVDLRIGTVALGSGEYRTVTKFEPDFDKWILASSAMPIVMPPVELAGDKWVDGGVRHQTPITSVSELIQMCIRRGEELEIDVVLTGPRKDDTPKVDPKKIKSLMTVALRCAELAIDEIYVSDFDRIDLLPNVVVYEPSKPIGFDSMEFNRKDLAALAQMGYDETNQRLSEV